MSDLHTFWDEEKQRSELHLNGWILYGDSEATRAVMDELNRLLRTSTDLRLWILEIDKAVSKAMNRGMQP